MWFGAYTLAGAVCIGLHILDAPFVGNHTTYKTLESYFSPNLILAVVTARWKVKLLADKIVQSFLVFFIWIHILLFRFFSCSRIFFGVGGRFLGILLWEIFFLCRDEVFVRDRDVSIATGQIHPWHERPQVGTAYC